jgi:hypothetical protein
MNPCPTYPTKKNNKNSDFSPMWTKGTRTLVPFRQSDFGLSRIFLFRQIEFGLQAFSDIRNSDFSPIQTKDNRTSLPFGLPSDSEYSVIWTFVLIRFQAIQASVRSVLWLFGLQGFGLRTFGLQSVNVIPYR